MKHTFFKITFCIISLWLTSCGRTEEKQSIAYLPNIDHTGIVVKNADKAAVDLENRFGAKTINKQTIKFSKVIYKGDTIAYSAYFVFMDMGNMKIEFIQPDFNVPSPYLDILNEKGEYAHHLCFLVKSVEEYTNKFSKNNPDFKVVVEAQAETKGKGGDMVYVEGVVPGTLVELATLIE